MILCHKCCGVLDAMGSETVLNGCQCISGYVRGFEPNLTVEQAATEQVKQEIEWLALKVRQGCPERWDSTRLVNAMKHCPHIGHGVIKWDKLAEKPVK